MAVYGDSPVNEMERMHDYAREAWTISGTFSLSKGSLISTETSMTTKIFIIVYCIAFDIILYVWVSVGEPPAQKKLRKLTAKL